MNEPVIDITNRYAHYNRLKGQLAAIDSIEFGKVWCTCSQPFVNQPASYQQLNDFLKALFLEHPATGRIAEWQRTITQKNKVYGKN